MRRFDPVRAVGIDVNDNNALVARRYQFGSSRPAWWALARHPADVRFGSFATEPFRASAD
jgi:hypothetical protein